MTPPPVPQPVPPSPEKARNYRNLFVVALIVVLLIGGSEVYLYAQFTSLQKRHEQLRRWKIEKINPTYSEFVAWLAIDATDQQEYVENVFDCDDFSKMLIEHGEQENGWDMALVIADGEDWGHAMCAIILLDRGLMWIEPQADEVFEPKQVGDQLYDWGVIVDICIIW